MKQLTAVIAICIMLAAVVACTGQGSAPGGIATSTRATTATPSTQTPVKLAMAFYQALKSEDYSKAYSYVSPNATTQQGQRLTRDAFIQLAQAADKESGPIIDFSAFAGSSDPSQVVMTVERREVPRYHAHLQLQKQGDTWYIISFDRL